MSIKSKVLSAAATLALLGGTAAAGVLAAGTAGAATPSCGPGGTTPVLHGCIDVFSREFGTHRHPGYVLDVFRQAERAGQPVILYRASNSDPAEDFTVSFQGLVSDFYAARMVSASVALHYGCTPGTTVRAPGGGLIPCAPGSVDEAALELEYSPFGVDSGLCAGVARTAMQGEGVTLQPCGVTAGTVWVIDTADSPATLASGYVPLINGSDTDFSHPFVLSYPANANPADRPRPQLKVTNLTGFSNGFGPVVGAVPDYQLWGADFGVLR